MKPIELDIIWKDDQTEKFELVGMRYKLSDCITRKVTFYNILAITPYFDEDDNHKEYCRIHCGEDAFISPLDYKSVQNIINLAYKPTKKT